MDRSHYRYALEPVLTKHRWDLDSLASELTAARRHLAGCDRAVDEARAAMADAWTQITRSRESDRLEIGREASLRSYAERMAQQLQQATQAQHEAQQLHDRVATQVRLALRTVRGMERHRERQQQAHQAAVDSAQAKLADDAWLLSQPPKAPTA